MGILLALSKETLENARLALIILTDTPWPGRALATVASPVFQEQCSAEELRAQARFWASLRGISKKFQLEWTSIVDDELMRFHSPFSWQGMQGVTRPCHRYGWIMISHAKAAVFAILGTLVRMRAKFETIAKHNFADWPACPDPSHELGAENVKAKLALLKTYQLRWAQKSDWDADLTERACRADVRELLLTNRERKLAEANEDSQRLKEASERLVMQRKQDAQHVRIDKRKRMEIECETMVHKRKLDDRELELADRRACARRPDGPESEPASVDIAECSNADADPVIPVC